MSPHQKGSSGAGGDVTKTYLGTACIENALVSFQNFGFTPQALNPCQESCSPTEANRKSPGCLAWRLQILKKVTEPLCPAALCTQAQGLALALRQVLGRFYWDPHSFSTTTTSKAHTLLSLQAFLKPATKKEAQWGENYNYHSVSRWHV